MSTRPFFLKCNQINSSRWPASMPIFAEKQFMRIPVLVLFLLVLYHLRVGHAQCPLIAPLSAFPQLVVQENGSSPFTPYVSASLKSNIASFITQHSIPEYAVSVVHEDRMVFTSGLSTIPFRIGSITKVFTALGALILRKRGKLYLDEPVKKFLPSFSIINPYDQGKFNEPHEITLRELMGHRSGLPRELCGTYYPTVSTEICPVDESEVLKAVAKMQLVRPPWSKEPAYSNLGFALLGHAWEKVACKPWDQFITEEVLRSLAMNDTGFDLTNVTLASNSDPLAKVDIGYIAPAGQMYSTATDLAKFLAFLLNASPPLISDVDIREWTQSANVFPDGQSAFALPWELLRVNFTEELLITKAGGISNFQTVLAVHPPTQLGVSVLFATNDSTDATPTTLAVHLLSILAPVVEGFNDKIIGGNYDGLYVCELSPPVSVPSIGANITYQVAGGYLQVTSSPKFGLSVVFNVTLLQDGQVFPQSGNLRLLMKNVTENSFWLGADDSCLDFFEGISVGPGFFKPNYPESIYEFELTFDLEKRTLKWPYIGAVCVLQNDTAQNRS